jgi:membrane associated rhomboid family serine protease
MGVLDELKTSFRTGTSLNRLIYINVGVFLVIKILEMLAFLLHMPALATNVIDYLAIPASMPILQSRPWTIITYMFLHQGFVHLLFNMLWLYWFGKIFITYLDQRKLVAVYLMGGIAGGLMYVAVFNIFPAFAEMVNVSIALGASASVMAMVIATAVYLPDMELYLLFFGRVKLKYLALATFLITSIFDFSVNTGGKIAHIGGALLGFAYGAGIKNGKDIGAWLNHILDFFVTIFKPRKKLKVTYKKPKTDYDYNKAKVERQHAIDHILDKISKGGYESLTKEEKDLLFRESQKKN